jgi:hypothetical protein
MSEKLFSRRGAFSLLGLAAAVGFAVPTTFMLTTEDAEAQTSPAAPAPTAPAPTATAPVAPAPSGMTRGEQRRAARRAGRQMRREARRNARQMRRQARRGMFMKSNQPMKQQ